MKTAIKIPIIIILMITCMSSCFKSCKKSVVLPACTSNCDTFKINGFAWDKPNNTPLKGVKLSIVEQTPSYITNNYTFPTITSDASGLFYFSTTIDTSIFNRSYLNFNEVYDTANYFESSKNQYNLYNYLFDSLHHLKQNTSLLEFYYYPKTKLTINMHRTSIDTFTQYQIYAIIDSVNVFVNIGNFYGYKNAMNTSFVIKSAYGIPTKIYTQKWLQDPQNSKPVSTVDSIFCNKNGSTVYDVYY